MGTMKFQVAIAILLLVHESASEKNLDDKLRGKKIGSIRYNHRAINGSFAAINKESAEIPNKDSYNLTSHDNHNKTEKVLKAASRSSIPIYSKKQDRNYVRHVIPYNEDNKDSEKKSISRPSFSERRNNRIDRHRRKQKDAIYYLMPEEQIHDMPSEINPVSQRPIYHGDSRGSDFRPPNRDQYSRDDYERSSNDRRADHPQRNYHRNPDFYMEDHPVEPFPGLQCQDVPEGYTEEDNQKQSEDVFVSQRILSCNRIKKNDDLPNILSGKLKGYTGKRKRSWVKCEVMKVSHCTVLSDYKTTPKPYGQAQENVYENGNENGFVEYAHSPHSGGQASKIVKVEEPVGEEPYVNPQRINDKSKDEYESHEVKAELPRRYQPLRNDKYTRDSYRGGNFQGNDHGSINPNGINVKLISNDHEDFQNREPRRQFHHSGRLNEIQPVDQRGHGPGKANNAEFGRYNSVGNGDKRQEKRPVVKGFRNEFHNSHQVHFEDSRKYGPNIPNEPFSSAPQPFDYNHEAPQNIPREENQKNFRFENRNNDQYRNTEYSGSRNEPLNIKFEPVQSIKVLSFDPSTRLKFTPKDIVPSDRRNLPENFVNDPSQELPPETQISLPIESLLYDRIQPGKLYPISADVQIKNLQKVFNPIEQYNFGHSRIFTRPLEINPNGGRQLKKVYKKFKPEFVVKNERIDRF